MHKQIEQIAEVVLQCFLSGLTNLQAHAQALFSAIAVERAGEDLAFLTWCIDTGIQID